MIAMCIARGRAAAEDVAQACVLDFEELPANWDMEVALRDGAPSFTTTGPTIASSPPK